MDCLPSKNILVKFLFFACLELWTKASKMKMKMEIKGNRQVENIEKMDKLKDGCLFKQYQSSIIANKKHNIY